MLETNITDQKSLQERIIFEVKVEYTPGPNVTRFGCSADLSAGGVFLKTKYPLAINDTLSLSLALPTQEHKEPISCAARVAWTNFENNRRKPSYPPGVGLQFLDLREEEFSMIEEFVAHYDETKKMNVVCAWCGSPLGLRKGPYGKTSHGICSQCSESMCEAYSEA